ncbi:MAG: FAD-dependent cmnm(5)s(2)U34 oxidoreductase, partial [Gammaproteobacteria bacterium]|nr:FAD-dependent cmnm(5)s(2)U34 oxidoreductase [Gammaproteobacteria bacterium]
MAKITLFSDPQLVPNANITWHQKAPVAADFDDFYGSTDDAIAEKTHVFLHPNKLPVRMQDMAPNAHLSVLELGFGGGLNFLLT